MWCHWEAMARRERGKRDANFKKKKKLREKRKVTCIHTAFSLGCTRMTVAICRCPVYLAEIGHGWAGIPPPVQYLTFNKLLHSEWKSGAITTYHIKHSTAPLPSLEACLCFQKITPALIQIWYRVCCPHLSQFTSQEQELFESCCIYFVVGTA